jgi:hypothetical protein
MAPVGPGWQLDKAGFRLFDGTQNNYGAPSGAGVTVEMPTATGNAFFRGTVVAAKIQGPQGGASGSGARMWFDFTAGDKQLGPAGATPGVSPYWAIADERGVTRVEAGILATLGVSPLQWGMRVNDANHLPIWDSLGLIGVNPNALLVDTYGITITTYAELASLALPPVSHVGVSYFAIATARLVFSEPAGVADTLSITLTNDGITQPYGGGGYAGSPQNGGQVTAVGPFVNQTYMMPTVFWAFTVPDTKAHKVSLMAGTTGGTINFALSEARLAVLQLGN